MALQSGKNVTVAYKEQSAFGTPESGSGGTVLTGLRAWSGLDLASADIQSQAIRGDGQNAKGRLGSQFVTATYPIELGVTNGLDFIEAGLRGTWVSEIALDESVGSLGGLTVGTATLTAAGGSWITQGVLAGQMIKLENHSEAANNDKWVRVLSVTASVITVPAASFEAASEDAEWDLTVARHVYPDDPPTERYYTIEEVYQDIDESVVGEDCKIGSLQIQVSADNLLTVTCGIGGRALEEYSDANSPQLTDPTRTESAALVLLDGLIRVRGTDWVNITTLDLTWQMSPQGQPVVGTRVSPDVFLSNAVGTGTISMLTEDLAEFTAFKAEDQVELFLVAQEPEADPADFIAIYVGNGGYRSSQRPAGNDGGLVQTHSFVFGVDDRGAGYAPGMMLVSTSVS
jgi:hypothetical protein